MQPQQQQQLNNQQQQIDNNNNKCIIGRRIDYTQNDNILQSRHSTNLKKFPLVLETSEKRITRQNMKLYPNTVKNSSMNNEENLFGENYASKIFLMDNIPLQNLSVSTGGGNNGGRSSRNNYDQFTSSQQNQEDEYDNHHENEQQQQQQYQSYSSNTKNQLQNSINNNNDKGNNNSNSKKQIIVSTLSSPVQKPLSASYSQGIKTCNLKPIKEYHQHPFSLTLNMNSNLNNNNNNNNNNNKKIISSSINNTQPSSATASKKKITLNKKSINDENKHTGNEQNEYQLNVDKKVENHSNSPPHTIKNKNKKKNSKKVSSKINSQSKNTTHHNHHPQHLSLQVSQTQLKLQNNNNIKGNQSLKNTQRSSHSPIDSPKVQQQLQNNKNANSSSNLKKRSTNSQLSKRRDSEVYKDQSENNNNMNTENTTNTKNNHNNNQKESIEQYEERKRIERLEKIKQLVDENIKKSLLEKQRKEEEKRFEEEQKKEKQMQMLKANLNIRHVNASRFSRNKVNSNDLARRLPWGINQEKLRNYAIQVLIQYRNQDQRSQSENIQSKYDDNIRRKQIGLDKLSEDEVQRLVQISKEKQKETQMLEEFVTQHLMSIQRKEQMENKKDEVQYYMEQKKQKIYKEEHQKKQQRLEEEQKKREQKYILEEQVKSIFKRLKKQKSSQYQKTKQQQIQPNQFHQSQLNRQSSSKNIQQRIPTSSQSNSKYLSPSSQHQYQYQNQQQDYNNQYQFKTEINNANNDSDYHLKSRQIKTEEGSTQLHPNQLLLYPNQQQIQHQNYIYHPQSNSQQQQLYGQQFQQYQMPYPQNIQQQQQLDGEDMEENDYSGLYEEFKQLITGQDDHYLLDIYKSPSQLHTQTQPSSQKKNPSFYRSNGLTPNPAAALSSSSQHHFNTQPSATASKILKKKTPQKSVKKGKRRVANTEGSSGKNSKKMNKQSQQSQQQLQQQQQQLSQQQEVMMMQTENEMNGSSYIRNNSSQANSLVITKQKFDDLTKRFNQIKLNTSKNDSILNNNLTKTNKQLIMNAEIEEKVESEDFESSRKEYENNDLHQIGNQIHHHQQQQHAGHHNLLGQQNGLQNQNGYQPNHMQQFQFDQSNNHHNNNYSPQQIPPIDQFINNPNIFIPNEGNNKQQQQMNDNIMEEFADSPANKFSDSVNGKQIGQNEHSSGSVIIKDSDIKTDHMLENNLLQSNEAFYKQLEMQHRQFYQEDDSNVYQDQKKLSTDQKKKLESQQQSQSPQQKQKEQHEEDEHNSLHEDHHGDDDLKKGYDSLAVNENEYQQDNLFTINNQQTELSFNVGDDELDPSQHQQQQQIYQQQQKQLQQQQQQYNNYQHQQDHNDEEHEHEQDDDDEDDEYQQHLLQQQQQQQQLQLQQQQQQDEEEEEEMDEEQLELLAQEIFNNAATYIQKIWRGYFTRKILTYYLEILENGEIDEHGNFREQNQMVVEDQEGENDNTNEQEQIKYAQMMQEYEKQQLLLQQQQQQDQDRDDEEDQDDEMQDQNNHYIDQNNPTQLPHSLNNDVLQNNLYQQQQQLLQQQQKLQQLQQQQQQQQQQNQKNAQQQQQQQNQDKKDQQKQNEQPLNKEWLMKQEKEEFLQNDNLVEDEDDQFDFQGDQENNEKFIHISTIKSSVISNDEVQFQKIDTILNSQNHLPNHDTNESGNKNQKSDKKGQQQHQPHPHHQQHQQQQQQLQQQQQQQQQNEIRNEEYYEYDEQEGQEQYEDQDQEGEQGQEEDEEYAQQQLEQFLNQMSEEDFENWNIVQERINGLTASNDPDQKDKIIQILQDLTPMNRERLLLCIDDNEDDSQNFSIEQIEAVFRSIPTHQYYDHEQKDPKYSLQDEQEDPDVYNQEEEDQLQQQQQQQQPMDQPKFNAKTNNNNNNINNNNEQNKKNLKNNNQLQIDIDIIEEDGKNNNLSIPQNKYGGNKQNNNNNNSDTNKNQNIEDNSSQFYSINNNEDNKKNNNNSDQNNKLKEDDLKNNQTENKKKSEEKDKVNPININTNNIPGDYQTTPFNPTKSLERSTGGSKNNSQKREKSHSFNYEAQSERSFNQMRRHKLNSPKDQRIGLRNSLSVQSDDNRSLDAVSPKEELNQLYALLQQEQMLQKKDKVISKNVSSKGSSLKGSARNINKELQQEMHNEYFENSQENPYSSNQDKFNNNNNSASSIFDKDSFKEFTDKKLKQIISEENINDILKWREQALDMRHKSSMNAINQMLNENHVSPRTYDSKKIELESWVKKEKEEISLTRKALERGLLKAMESIKKTQRDVQLAQRFKNNPTKFDSRSSFASEEEYLFRRKFEQEGASQRSDSDTHSDNLSSSQALKCLLKEVGTPTSRNNIKIIDKFEVKEKQDHDGNQQSDTDKKQQQKGGKSQISKMYNKKYADGDNDDDENNSGDEEQEDFNIEDEDYSTIKSQQQDQDHFQDNHHKNKNNNKSKKSSKDNRNQHHNEDDQESYQKSGSPSSAKKEGVLPGQNVKLVLDYNDFDSGSAIKGNEQNLKIPTLSSSNESLSFYQQQNLDRLINEKMVFNKKDGSQSGKSSKISPRYEDASFPFSPLSDASKELYQFHSSSANGTAPSNNNNQQESLHNQHLHHSEDQQSTGKYSPSKKSPRDQSSSLKESNSEEDEIEELKFYEEKEFQERHIAFQQLSQPSAEFMERNEILAEMQDRWRTFNQIDSRIQEQLHRIFAQDKSDNYGIATNIKIMTDYVDRLFAYVCEKNQEEFLQNLNTPFGFAPSKRLKLIHGYDSFVDNSVSDEGGSTDDYNTLPFVLSEELFIEFEQNIIGNGESEKEQIIKEFEHIHNKAIFDTFNEALNIFRPYYTLGGPPYSWTKSEKNLVLGKATHKNLSFILEKSKARVIEWGSYLCGLVNEEEIQRQIPLEDEKGNPPPLSVLLENLTPQNEYLAQVREERLSKMLLTEIFENEYKWQLYEDEKAEVVMELADLVFEELVEEIVNDMAEK